DFVCVDDEIPIILFGDRLGELEPKGALLHLIPQPRPRRGEEGEPNIARAADFMDDLMLLEPAKCPTTREKRISAIDGDQMIDLGVLDHPRDRRRQPGRGLVVPGEDPDQSQASSVQVDAISRRSQYRVFSTIFRSSRSKQ